MLFLIHRFRPELDPGIVYVQAVSPSAPRNEIRERIGRDLNMPAGVMDADELANASLVGFDRREARRHPRPPSHQTGSILRSLGPDQYKRRERRRSRPRHYDCIPSSAVIPPPLQARTATPVWTLFPSRLFSRPPSPDHCPRARSGTFSRFADGHLGNSAPLHAC